MKPTTPAKPRGKAPGPPPAMERVRLQREHTHMGEKKPPGAEITVHPETARWLRDAGVIPKE